MSVHRRARGARDVAPRGTHTDTERAALDRAAGLVGDRWTLLLVHALLAGPARFSQLQQDVDGISPNLLTARLRQLVGDGLVVAAPYQDRPVRHQYALTDRGHELADVLRLLAAWADPAVERPVHGTCGTPLRVVHWCPTCEQPTELDEELVRL